MIDPKLYTLVAAYECGSFIAAAQKLSITQPAVSQHIRALEEELGIRIFQRGSGGLVITEQGKQAVRTAQKMIGLYNLLRQDLTDRAHMQEHLNIGVTHTAESNAIAEALAKYGSENEGVTIKIISDTISNLYKRLRSYELDFAFVEGRRNEPGIKFLMLDTDCLILAVSPNHAFAGRGMVTLEELKREKLILRLPNSGTRNLFVAHLESNNMSISEFDVLMELDNVATIKDLIRRDFGVSILPRSACYDEIRKKKLIALPVENLSMVREMNIAYQNDFSHTEMLSDIMKAYNEMVRLYR